MRVRSNVQVYPARGLMLLRYLVEMHRLRGDV